MLSSSSEVAFCNVCKHFMKVMESTTSVTPGLFLHAIYLECYASPKTGILYIILIHILFKRSNSDEICTCCLAIKRDMAVACVKLLVFKVVCTREAKCERVRSCQRLPYSSLWVHGKLWKVQCWIFKVQKVPMHYSHLLITIQIIVLISVIFIIYYYRNLLRGSVDCQ